MNWISNNAHYLWWSNKEPSTLPLGQGGKPAYKECKVKWNHNWKRISAQKPYYENAWHANITKPITIHFFVHFVVVLFSFIAKLSCFAKLSMFPRLTTSDKKDCWWSLFSQTFKWILAILKMQVISSIPISGWDPILWAHEWVMWCSFLIFTFQHGYWSITLSTQYIIPNMWRKQK